MGMILSKLHSESDHNAQLKRTMLDLESEDSWGMTSEHVMALMVYCNFTSVQFELKQTYFRLKNESDKNLKKRHSVFGHLGRLLKEIVCDYGMQCDQKSRARIFYHSVSMKSISTTLIKFRAPISTSTSRMVLFNYSSINGTIIELNPGHLDLIGGGFARYFDCSWISDFGVEEEKLFIGQSNPLELSNIIDMKLNISYQVFVFALNIITTVFGEINESWDREKKNPFEAIPKKKEIKK